MERRSSRRCVRNKNAVPSAVHYVGYVEDDETPEMIMKKFEELERIKAAAAAAKSQSKASDVSSDGVKPPKLETFSNDGSETTGENPKSEDNSSKEQTEDPNEEESLNEQLLLEVFKQTSIFNIKSALHNNDFLLEGENRAGRSDDEVQSDSDRFHDDSDFQGFWTDDDADATGGRRQRPPRAEREKTSKVTREGQARHVRQQVVTQFNKDSHAFIRRKARNAADAGGLQQIRVPAPVPLSWARTIQSYVPEPDEEAQIAQVTAEGQPGGRGPEDTVSFETGNVDKFPWASLNKQYQAIMIGGGWWGRPAVPEAGHDGQKAAVVEGDMEKTGGKDKPAGGSASDKVQVAAMEKNDKETTNGNGTCDAEPNGIKINGNLRNGQEQQQQQQQQQQYQSAKHLHLLQQKHHGDPQRISSSSAASPSTAGDRGTYTYGTLLSRLARLPLDSLCPQGFLFIWVEKSLIQGVVLGLAQRGFVYVENLTWVFCGPANQILTLGGEKASSPTSHSAATTQPSSSASTFSSSSSSAAAATAAAASSSQSLFFRRSHATLLILRREGRDIELRHQRSPDVIFDCLHAPSGRSGCQWATPPEVYTTIETMLPTGKGKMLEIWAPESTPRPGWDRITEVPPEILNPKP